jgi:hypothetical protein
MTVETDSVGMSVVVISAISAVSTAIAAVAVSPTGAE